MFSLTLMTSLIIFVDSAFSANILCVLPYFGMSHHMAFSTYIQKLADNGHNLTIISPYPSNHPNITEISMSAVVDPNYNKRQLPDKTGYSLDQAFRSLYRFYQRGQHNAALFQVDSVKRFYTDDSSEFDLLITEHFNNEIPLVFAMKYNVPFILLSSCGLLPWSQRAVGQPYNVATVSSVLGGYNKKMNVFERAMNAFEVVVYVLGYVLFFQTARDEEIIKTNLGVDVSLAKLVQNASMIFVNTHYSMHGTVPVVPAVVEVGGLHIKPKTSLSADIQQFIDESEHGVIYFCMGSLLRGETFAAEKRSMFLNAFQKLPQRVLWKWENDDLPDKTANIMIRKWMPQRDILAHPKVKLFISHGGLLGLTEAVHEGVPTLAMPIFGDQLTNVKAIMDTGAAEILDYNTLSEIEIFSKAKEMLTNPIYKQKATKLSEVFRDRPMSPMETAMYWTEYVIRHKGAPHLRSPAVGMPWYQYYMIDIISMLLICVFAILLSLHYFISTILSLLRPSKKLKIN
ncbi:UDP-glycosyltransferase UGT5-like isoform X2 [Adelges cooleyi]|uniref:UDP-glycosyltransferase UGT5-like isoform X2 n=1 Tax=Adelges cooleyi TaxID=133065 RepID=UPI00217FD609|nr:UDP-glycosyltransferase UGT5-like isoform X2 [Adelges cooleyi]